LEIWGRGIGEIRFCENGVLLLVELVFGLLLFELLEVLEMLELLESFLLFLFPFGGLILYFG
jgi:hypothetical protein